jgi:hypothetical protein
MKIEEAILTPNFVWWKLETTMSWINLMTISAKCRVSF